MDKEVGRVYIWWCSPDSTKDKHIVITGVDKENYMVRFLYDGREREFPKWQLEKWKGYGDHTQCGFKYLFKTESDYYEGIVMEEKNKIEQSKKLIEKYEGKLHNIESDDSIKEGLLKNGWEILHQYEYEGVVAEIVFCSSKKVGGQYIQLEYLLEFNNVALTRCIKKTVDVYYGKHTPQIGSDDNIHTIEDLDGFLKPNGLSVYILNL